jgi:hypothetical protein
MVRQIIVACCIGLGVSACAPMTDDMLRKVDEQKQRSFNVDSDFHAVFQAMLDKSRACFLNVPGDAQYTVVGNRIEPGRSAEIVVAEVYGPKSREALMLIDVIAINQSETQVRSYHSSRRMDDYVANLRVWLTDPNGSCELISERKKRFQTRFVSND